jgi:hypothetical protein
LLMVYLPFLKYFATIYDHYSHYKDLGDSLQEIWFFATTFFVKSCYKSLAKLPKIVLPATCNKKSCCKKSYFL